MSKVKPLAHILLRLGLAFLFVPGCNDGMYASIPTGTKITPDYFQFAVIVPEEEEGGWRAVCIKALVGQRTMHTPHGPVTADGIICAIEVGVPISTRDGTYIPLPLAQKISADIANSTAYRVLEESPTEPMAVICRRITTEMHTALRAALEGSRVNQCGATKWKKPVPTVEWPRRP